MAVRNFWLEAEIDGYKNKLSGGPRSKTDGMEVTLYQRDKGQITKAVRITCTEMAGTLFTDVYINGKFCGRYETQR